MQEEHEEDPAEFDEDEVRSCVTRDSLSAGCNTWDPKGAQSVNVCTARKAHHAHLQQSLLSRAGTPRPRRAPPETLQVVRRPQLRGPGRVPRLRAGRRVQPLVGWAVRKVRWSRCGRHARGPARGSDYFSRFPAQAEPTTLLC
jgi:hypothetical protein